MKRFKITIEDREFDPKKPVATIDKSTISYEFDEINTAQSREIRIIDNDNGKVGLTPIYDSDMMVIVLNNSNAAVNFHSIKDDKVATKYIVEHKYSKIREK